MAYDENLSDRVRELIAVVGDDITEKKMFGGLCFLYKGKMTVGLSGDNLIVRVVADKYEAYLERTHVGLMDFTGKPMKEFITVKPPAFEKEAELQEWVDLGVEHAKWKLKEI